MKNVLVVISFLFLFQTANAQLFKKEKVTYDSNQGRGSTDNNLLRWGYFLGINNYDFNFDYKTDLRDVYVKRSPGFSVGLIGKVFSKDRVAYKYLCESASIFPYGEALNNILRKIGFINVEDFPQTLGVATIYTSSKK